MPLNSKMEEKVTNNDDKIIKFVRNHPVFFFHKKEVIEETFDYMPHDDDIIVAAYPKSGINWTCAIVFQILSNATPLKNFNELFYKMAPFMQLVGFSGLETLQNPRVYKHHFPYDLMRRNPKSKLIYIYRKPDDIFASYYHFIQSFTGRTLDIDSFFEDFLIGNVPYGSYFKFVSSYLKHKDDKNILFLSYEMMLQNREKEILKIAKFLSDEFYNNLVCDETLLGKILEATNFEYMQKNFTLTYPKSLENLNNIFDNSEDTPMKCVNFFRKGKIGDGKTILNENQLNRMKVQAYEIMKDKGFLADWFEN